MGPGVQRDSLVGFGHRRSPWSGGGLLGPLQSNLCHSELRHGAPESDLGEIEVVDDERVEVSSFGLSPCTQVFSADVKAVSVALSEGAAPWADALQFWVTVDGNIWADHRRQQPFMAPVPPGYGGTNVYRNCDQDVSLNLEAGSHEVVIHASLPGTDLELSTPPVEIELACEHDVRNANGEPDLPAPSETEPAGPLMAGSGCSTSGRRSGFCWLTLLSIAASGRWMRRGRSHRSTTSAKASRSAPSGQVRPAAAPDTWDIGPSVKTLDR